MGKNRKKKVVKVRGRMGRTERKKGREGEDIKSRSKIGGKRGKQG